MRGRLGATAASSRSTDVPVFAEEAGANRRSTLADAQAEPRVLQHALPSPPTPPEGNAGCRTANHPSAAARVPRSPIGSGRWAKATLSSGRRRQGWADPEADRNLLSGGARAAREARAAGGPWREAGASSRCLQGVEQSRSPGRDPRDAGPCVRKPASQSSRPGPEDGRLLAARRVVQKGPESVSELSRLPFGPLRRHRAV